MTDTAMRKYLALSFHTDLIGKDRFLYRILEILPGFIAWITLLLVVLFSFILPFWIAVFIIIFDVYWLLKTIFLSLHLRTAFRKTQKNLEINWLHRLEQKAHWRNIYHLVILPFYKEDAAMLRNTIGALKNARYPKDRLIIVLAPEERAGEGARRIAYAIKKDFEQIFYQFFVIIHPKNLPGEIPGKGSNIAWAGKQVKKEIDRLGMSYRHILVSAFDIDSVIFSEYFARLTYVFLNTKNNLRASYQPVPFYINNIWQSPSFSRVVGMSATFWHMLQQERPERGTTFSSHSMPFQALVDVNFWQKNVVSEDSRIFWNCFLYYNGDYRVIPLYYPISMDANLANSRWHTLVNVYKQQRRWGWGVENIPYFLFGFIKNKAIPRFKKWYYGFSIIEGFWSWATNALIIFLLGWLPVVVGGRVFNASVLSLNLPYVTRGIMTFAMVGLVSSAVFSIVILPPRPTQYRKTAYAWMVLQWALLPITMITLGALPGLEAQTRLMIKKYLGFWVTPKRRNG